jgi:two-component system response regulator YesN
MEVATAVREEIESERRLRNKMEQSIPIVKEHYMNQLIGGLEVDRRQIRQQFDFLGIDLDLENITVLTCELDNYLEDRMEIQLALLQLQEISQEVLGGDCQGTILNDLKDREVIVCNCPKEMNRRDFALFLQGKALRIQRQMKELTDKTVSVGISRIIPDILRLSKAYKEAEKALSYRFFMGTESIVFIGDIEREQRGNSVLVKEREESLAECIQVGDSEGTRRILPQYFEALLEYSAEGQAYIMEKLKAFVSFLERTLDIESPTDRQDIRKELGELSAALSEQEKYPTLGQVEQFVRTVLVNVSDRINADRLLRNEGIIEKAKKYIKHNLAGDVSLITVAESVFVSPNYLSFLFKENGENFKDYVVRVKMERAKEMLEEGSSTLNQVAHELGYKDGRYLSQIYKKFWGRDSGSVEVSAPQK